MTSIKKTKKFLKNSKRLALTIFLKEESEEDGNKFLSTEQDIRTFTKFGMKVQFPTADRVIDVIFIPYWRMGKVYTDKPIFE